MNTLRIASLNLEDIMNREPLLGDRVRVLPQCPWAKGVTATVIGGLQGDSMKYRRIVACGDGPRIYYFLAFDQPQMDNEGAGPFIGAEIEARYLEVLHESERNHAS
jgi:hypothetical protein